MQHNTPVVMGNNGHQTDMESTKVIVVNDNTPSKVIIAPAVGAAGNSALSSTLDKVKGDGVNLFQSLSGNSSTSTISSQQALSNTIVMKTDNEQYNISSNNNNTSEIYNSEKQVINSTSVPFIYQVSVTGSLNRPTWTRLAHSLRNYVSSNKLHPKALGPCDLTLTSSNMYYELRYYLLRYLPYLAMKGVVNLPGVQVSDKNKKIVANLGKAVRRAYMLNNEFQDFMNQ